MSNVKRAVLPVLLSLTACSHHNSASAPAQPIPPGTVLTAEDIRNSPGQSLEEMLMARVPGLTMTHTLDGRTVLQLRGDNTILGDAEPLFVVNGIPLGPAASSNLSAIDIHDIETVQVLRDAAATAAYGVRGGNGVIIIRTKRT